MKFAAKEGYLYNVKTRVVIACICVAFFACKSPQVDVATDSKELSEAPYTIDTAFISGDSLHTTLTYTGGCHTHTFEIASNGFLLKSLPPKQPIRIIHRSDDDPCRAFVKENLIFDISEFKGTPSGSTLLILENWNQHLSYSY